jgi:hypothetical protein
MGLVHVASVAGCALTHLHSESVHGKVSCGKMGLERRRATRNWSISPGEMALIQEDYNFYAESQTVA